MRPKYAGSLSLDARGQPMEQCRGRLLVDEESCPGHVASDADPRTCGRCGVHVDSLRPCEEDTP